MTNTLTHPTPTTGQAPPMLKHAPLIGHTLDMARDPLQLLVRGYQTLGSVFRIRVGTRVFHVIAGPEAFDFVAQGGEAHLEVGPALGATGLEVGARRTLVTVEGEVHHHMRKAQRAGFSRSAFMQDAPRAIAQTTERLKTWQAGQVIDVFPTFQRLVMEQLALALIGEEANAYFDDVRIYIGTLLNIHVHGLWPKWMTRWPRFVRAKQRFLEIGNHILNKRRSGQSPARGDLIDDVLTYKDLDGVALDDRELLMSAMSPFIAGMDTAAAMSSYLLYDLLKHPEILAQVVQEVDQHLRPDAISAEMFMAMPTLHNAAMETLRMHTIALAQPRVIAETFTFGGYTFPKGASLWMSGSVSHFLPQFYAEPYRYDVTRYHAPRNEHRQKNAYAPYGIGAHLCLGAGVAELQFPLNVALWLQRFALKPVPSHYTLKLSNNPTPHPSGFKVQIASQRASASA